MNIGWLFLTGTYIVLASIVVGALPSELFAQPVTSAVPTYNLAGYVNSSATAPDTLVSQLGFFQKFIKFFFVTWTIPGIPAFLGLFVLFLNIMSIAIPIIFVVDKIRGIG